MRKNMQNEAESVGLTDKHGVLPHTWYSAAVDLKAHADALLPGKRADTNESGQSRFGEEGTDFVCWIAVPQKDLEIRRIKKLFLFLLMDSLLLKDLRKPTKYCDRKSLNWADYHKVF